MSRSQEKQTFVSWEEIVNLRETVFLICLGFSRNRTQAEDLVQDVYLKAWIGHLKLRNPEFSRFWLFRVARNTCLDHCKRHSWRRLLPFLSTNETLEDFTPEHHVMRWQEISRMKQAMEKMPLKLREILVLREYGELSYLEIAELLKIQRGTVMSRLNRARSAILKLLQEDKNGAR